MDAGCRSRNSGGHRRTSATPSCDILVHTRYQCIVETDVDCVRSSRGYLPSFLSQFISQLSTLLQSSCPPKNNQKAKVHPSRNTGLSSPNSTKTNTCSGDDYCSARETSGSPTPTPQPISVQDAINEAPAFALKSLMQRLSANVPEARAFIEATLLRPLHNNDNGESSSSNGLKRKAMEECKNCKEYYEVDDNRKKRCRYHPGEFPSWL